MTTHDEIEYQQQQLYTYREVLKHQLRRATHYGGEAVAPIDAIMGIQDARAAIRRIKVWLRQQGVEVDDQFNDEPSREETESKPVASTPPTITIYGGTFHGSVGQAGGKSMNSLFNQQYDHVDNVYNIAGSLNMGPTPDKDAFLAALRQFKAEVDKAKDLPQEDAIDVQNDVDSAIRTAQQPKPDKPRLADRLESAKKVLDGLAGSAQSAMALGMLLGELIAKLPHLPV